MHRIHMLRALLATAVLSGTIAAQSQILLSEDFETGIDGWTLVQTGGAPKHWHHALDGECGQAVTSMAGYNLSPAACNYQTGTNDKARLISQSFVLTGKPPYLLSFQYKRQMDVSDDHTNVLLLKGPFPGTDVVVIDSLIDNSGSLQTIAADAIPASLVGETVELEFEIITGSAGNAGFGVYVDNIVVTNSGPTWTDLGQGKAGVAGVPLLTGTGNLAAGQICSLDLASAAPNATTTLVFGLSPLNAPFKGGQLVPEPLVLLTLPTDATGAAGLHFVMPSGVPSDTSLFLQFWTSDAAATFGLSASNGLLGSTF